MQLHGPSCLGGQYAIITSKCTNHKLILPKLPTTKPFFIVILNLNGDSSYHQESPLHKNIAGSPARHSSRHEHLPGDGLEHGLRVMHQAEANHLVAKW